MISAISSAISGLKAAFKMLDSSANNLANADTGNFKKDRVDLSEGEDGGVVVRISKDNGPGPRSLDPEGNTVEGSNTSYADEMVNLIEAKLMAKANLAVIKAEEETKKNVIDIFA